MTAARRRIETSPVWGDDPRLRRSGVEHPHRRTGKPRKRAERAKRSTVLTAMAVAVHYYRWLRWQTFREPL